MTPEEYIEKLKTAQHSLDNAKDDLDRAINRMQRRIETGYGFMERDSRLAALVAREVIRGTVKDIFETATAKIDFTNAEEKQK